MEVSQSFLKSPSGFIFQILPGKTSGKLFLRSKNNYYKDTVQGVRKKLDTDWSHATKLEVEDWLKKDDEYIEAFTRKLVKRIILAQVLIEQNDELIADNVESKHLVNLLRKSNKELERIVGKHFDNIYGADKTITTNLSNAIDKVSKQLSELQVQQFIIVEDFLTSLKNNPEQYEKKSYQLTKIEE